MKQADGPTSLVETVEIVKNALVQDLDSQEFKRILQKAVKCHPQAMLRTSGGEPLFCPVVNYLCRTGDRDSLEYLSNAFVTVRVLGKSVDSYKRMLTRRISNGFDTPEEVKAAIAGLFVLPISHAEVARVVKMAEKWHLKPDMWCVRGLRYSAWRNYCTSYNLDGQFRKEVDAFNSTHFPDQQCIYVPQKLKNLQIVSNSQQYDWLDLDESKLLKLKTSISLPEPDFRAWESLLKSPSLSKRSVIVSLLSVYVADGKYMFSVLEFLTKTCTKLLSTETLLTAMAQSCVALSRQDTEKPARFSSEPIYSNNSGNSQPKGPDCEIVSPGVWSYVDCMGALQVLYLQLIKAAKSELPTAAFAARQFRNIAYTLNRTPWQLFQPFWPLLAPSIVGHYNDRFVDWFCRSVLQVKRQDFLLRISAIVVPHLCFDGQDQLKVCEEIARYRGCTPKRLYMDNFAAIIARLLMDSTSDIERAWSYAEDRYIALDRTFTKIRFVLIVATCRVDVIYEILLLINDDESNAPLVVGHLNKIMDCAYAELGGDRGELLQQTVFKLVVKFGETMRNLMGKQPQYTKLCALRGLSILVSRFLTPTLLSSVLRQLTAFLQSTFDINALSQASLQVWFALIRKLDDSKLESIVDLTYSIINQKVELWDREACEIAYQIVSYIKKKTGGKLRDITKIHPTSVFDGILENTNELPPPSYDILLSLVERDTENSYAAHQTANDLYDFGLEHQDEIREWSQAGGTYQELLGSAARVLLMLCAKGDPKLQQKCAQALGLFGALDPHKTGIEPKETPLIMTSNFTSPVETIEFSRNLVKDWFLPAFEAAVDPVVQRYFAYGIQELLKLMAAEEENRLKKIFLDESLVNTLLPLVKTKYTTEIKHWKPPTYPIYKPTRSFNFWLSSFCSDMMGRTSEPEPATQIFGWCRKVLFGSNASADMWAYLLPFAALAAVVDVNDRDNNRNVFLNEILLVLNLTGPTLQAYYDRIFAVVDYFNQWMRSRRQAKQDLFDIDKLLAQIPASLMAQRALESGAYPRAIRYYEKQVREDPSAEEYISKILRHIYASMQDIDALEGVSAQMSTLSVEQQALEYRATSQWDSALACYSALPISEENMMASLQCLQRSGRVKEVLVELSTNQPLIAEGSNNKLAPLGTECAWSVCDWSSLTRWTMMIDGNERNNSNQIPSGAFQAMGNALLALKSGDYEMFKSCLDAGHRITGGKLGDIMTTHHITSLRQIRELMVYLHGLVDLENVGAMASELTNAVQGTETQEEGYKLMKKHLEGRFKIMSSLNEGPEFEDRKFLLKLRGASLECVQARIPYACNLAAEAHLSLSEAARKHGQSSIALMEIAAAKEIGVLNNLRMAVADAEYAQLLWTQGESRSAIRTMQALVPPEFFKSPKKYSESAEHALQLTVWRDAAAQADSKVIIEHYGAVIRAAPQLSEAHYRLAKHYVKVYDESSIKQRASGEIAKRIVYHFTMALQLGTQWAAEALPKMLTTWLDLGVQPQDITEQDASSRRHMLSAANKYIQQWGDNIDSKLIYTAVPQLLSRHNHSNSVVRMLVKQLIVIVAQQYPHQTLWPLLEKVSATKPILDEAIHRAKGRLQSKLSSLVQRSMRFVEKLKRICKVRVNTSKVKLSELGEDFRSYYRSKSDEYLAVPVQAAMDTLENILLIRIEDDVIIQSSMVRPKRIEVLGSNGQKYLLLLKGSDDLRKDARLFEFTAAVNLLLKSDPVSAARHLHIMSYRVTPLDEECGIIEWVDGAKPLRSILTSLSPVRRLGYDSAPFKRMINTELDLKQRKAAFMELQNLVKPVLWEWFVDTFPDPETWLVARTRYARSLAVMSMVGYVLGLGDRHLDNLLLVQNSGIVLHVDFDCLFDKGKRLAVPETVPFRLTQQLRDALGVINGYEGPFRKVSEITLKIVRSNEDLLMVVLEAFIHDPVVNSAQDSPSEAMETTRAKIRGIKVPNSVPLSVSGLVDELIQQATSPENLCQLFKGWHSWV